MPYLQVEEGQSPDPQQADALSQQVEQLLKVTSAGQCLKGDNNFLNYIVHKDRVLFKGLYSTIYACENSQDKSVLMCRVFNPNAKLDPLNEVYLKILRFVGKHSPNIIHTYDIFYDETNHIFLFQEYANRGNCLEHLRAGNYVDLKLMAKWAYSIWRAMDFLGNCAICHRSIRPKHVLLLSGDAGGPITAKLSGFRDSMIYWDAEKKCVVKMPKRPVAGMRYATFQAPETFGNESETFDPIAADVWSFGATFFYIVGRFYPFDVEKTSEPEEIAKNIQQRINSTVWLNAGAKNWFQSLLAIDPKQRMKFNEIVNDSWFRSEQ